MANFTKQPWGRNIPPASKYNTIYAGRNTHICHLARGDLPEDEIEANCNLIVAAPSMHECLEKAVQLARQQAKGGDDAPLPSAWAWFSDMAQNVLNKAEGIKE